MNAPSAMGNGVTGSNWVPTHCRTRPSFTPVFDRAEATERSAENGAREIRLPDSNLGTMLMGTNLKRRKKCVR